MASRKFRFVSPGVFLKEIDNSQLPGQAPGIGPVLIGRTRRGPAMKAYKVKSQEEFERVFGKPMPGNQGSDPWREGTDILAESYVPYAAKAYLSADISSPVTVVRLAGVAGDDSIAGTDGEPGWKASNAYGLFFFASGSHSDMSAAATKPDLELAAVFYGTNDLFGIKLKGQSLSSSANITADPGDPVLFSSTSNRLSLLLSGSSSRSREVKFLAEEIRKDFNTNPVATNSRIMSPAAATLADQYWLGESFEETIRKFESSITDSNKRAAVVLKLDDEMAEFRSSKHALTAARTGWIVSNDTRMDNTLFSVTNQQKLFRLIALHEGQEASANLLVGIEDIKIPRDGELGDNQYGSFSVVVKKIHSSGLEDIERFDGCNLNPNSDKYVAKMIGDQYVEWSTKEKRNKLYGTHPNISEYVRVEMNSQIDSTQGPDNISSVPFGFLGPIAPKGVSGSADSGIIDVTEGTVGEWVNSTCNVTMSSVPSITASWAEFPVVMTGSSGDGYYMGATPYKRTYSSGKATTTTEEINPGYADHVRRLADLDSGILTRDQDDGEAASGENIHSFAFSLDEVVLVPSPVNNIATASITSVSDITSAQYTAGSKKEAKAVLVDAIDTTGVSAGNTFTITVPTAAGGDGLTYTVLFDTTTNIDGNSGARTYGVSTQRIADDGDGAAVLILAINGQVDAGSQYKYGDNNHDASPAVVHKIPGITASPGSTATKITLTMDTAGTAGNVANVLAASSGFAGAKLLEAAFSGGEDSTSFSGIIAAGSGSAAALRPLTEIVKGFHVPLVGGFDGTNITEANPFNNNIIEGKNTSNHYAYASLDRAVEIVKDPEAIEHNLALMPGVTNTSLTTKLVRACESRGDSLAIIDLPGVYVPPSEDSCTNFAARIQTTPENTAKALVKRQLNSSYGAAYYPWCKIRDDQNSRDVWVPPSVVALGVMAYTEERDEVWFAPAGFNRGGLNQGNAGVPVLQVSEQLLSRDRDTLYEANVNPIASFVSEGLVVFGQKTLQSTQSALDRINVRRLLIFIKKVVSRISNNLLFEQNVRETWNRFISAVVPELQSIKTRFGLSDFKVVLDDTTTTPDLVDRNIMYAKIFLKPARSIEFIAVDFVITNTGASFDD